MQLEPAVYRSGSSLQPVQAGEPVVLRDINSVSMDETEQAPTLVTPTINSVAHLVDTPLETFDDRSVIHWLGSPHTKLREQGQVGVGFTRLQSHATRVCDSARGRGCRITIGIGRHHCAKPRGRSETLVVVDCWRTKVARSSCELSPCWRR